MSAVAAGSVLVVDDEPSMRLTVSMLLRGEGLAVREAGSATALTGPLFNEPMRVEMVVSSRPSTWTVRLVGIQTQQFRRVALTREQFATLTIVTPSRSYGGDSGRMKLAGEPVSPILDRSRDRRGAPQDPVKNSARFEWHEVRKVEHYWLGIDALTHPMRLRENEREP